MKRAGYDPYDETVFLYSDEGNMWLFDPEQELLVIYNQHHRDSLKVVQINWKLLLNEIKAVAKQDLETLPMDLTRILDPHMYRREVANFNGRKAGVCIRYRRLPFYFQRGRGHYFDQRNPDIRPFIEIPCPYNACIEKLETSGLFKIEVIDNKQTSPFQRALIGLSDSSLKTYVYSSDRGNEFPLEDSIIDPPHPSILIDMQTVAVMGKQQSPVTLTSDLQTTMEKLINEMVLKSWEINRHLNST